MNTITCKIKGMHCASCAARIEKTVGKQPGVHHVSVNYGTEEAKIDFDTKKTSVAELSKTIEPLGYRLEAHMGSGHDHGAMTGMSEVDVLQKKMNIALPIVALTVCVMVWELLILPLGALPEMPSLVERALQYLFPILSAYMLFGIGTPYLQGVWVFLRRGAATMDTLVGIGTLTAFLYSFIVTVFAEPLQRFINTEHTYYDVTIVVIGLISFGKYLEVKAKLRTGDAIKKLIGLQVKTALVVRGGKEMEISIDQVVHGDNILVKPGMKVPVDGIIENGQSFLDESMLSGEAMPVQKSVGEKVAAGTINTTGSFTMKATGVGEETVLAHIIAMVKDAQGSKAPIQKLADKISAVFVPIVLVVAVVTLATWLVVGSSYMPFAQALSFGLVCFVGVLVIACPCALGLATPTAIIVGVGRGASQGILIKNAEMLEKLHKVTTLVTDKTGTLTQGKPTLLLFKTISDVKENEALSILASLEKQSEHPLGASIVSASKEKKVTLQSVNSFENIPGKGIKGVVGGELYYAGGLALLSALGLKENINDLNKIAAEGKTPVVLATENKVIAVAGIGDEIKPEAKEAIKTLHRMGVKIIMATGDHEGAAQYVAKELGIDSVLSSVLPQDKLEKIKEFQAKGEVVAMAGDGVNDAPALAQADVGIAMSTGTDVSIETSDVTLLHGDISKIAEAIVLSRQTMRTIKQNLFWAFVYNIVGIPLASGIFYPLFGWLLSPVFAGFAMAFSSVSVVTNSLRLKYERK